MVNYYDCLLSDNTMIVAVALFNCCYVFQKFEYLDELELRKILIRSFNFLPSTNVILSFDSKISLLSPIHVTSFNVSMYTAFRALEMNRY